MTVVLQSVLFQSNIQMNSCALLSLQTHTTTKFSLQFHSIHLKPYDFCCFVQRLCAYLLRILKRPTHIAHSIFGKRIFTVLPLFTLRLFMFAYSIISLLFLCFCCCGCSTLDPETATFFTVFDLLRRPM